MALGEHETVAAFPLGVFGADIQLFKIQIGKQLRSGHTAAGVAAFCAVGTLDNAHTHLAGENFQFVKFSGGHMLAYLGLKLSHNIQLYTIII